MKLHIRENLNHSVVNPPYEKQKHGGEQRSGILNFQFSVFVIMIMPFDPFGHDHIIYTIKNTCLEVPELPYEDGARTLFLYIKGTKGDCGEEQKELLRYMEHSVSENANCNAVKEIHDMVEHVKQDAEVSLEYMKVYEKERMLIEEGIEQGIEQGIERGIEQGRQQAELEFEAERLKLEEEIRLLRKELAEQQEIK